MHNNVESLCFRIWCTPGRIQRPRDLLQTSGNPRSSPRSLTKVVDTANGSLGLRSFDSTTFQERKNKLN
eukprot:7001841-Prymnesium_polylepis.1